MKENCGVADLPSGEVDPPFGRPSSEAVWNGGNAGKMGKEKIFHPVRFICTLADPAVAAVWNGGNAGKKGKEKGD
ncbi:hypothetical protein NDU88_002731 [Pleurodeles waltl]|uniref:Uncharacterized protein n=1 Tax=Pleurodeles waltl TaxID=8319 RepID=A0AAV7VF82_PLEWA|nr:hypothetical protein NDU88_002731 [Pleurodeles waltl]